MPDPKNVNNFISRITGGEVYKEIKWNTLVSKRSLL